MNFSIWDDVRLENGTIPIEDSDIYWRNVLERIEEIMIFVIFVVIMFAMGIELSWQEIKCHLSKPVAPAIGMFCQFIVMPLSAFGLILACGISGLYATGILLISCSPGGTLSNVFTYLTNGNVSLSMTMTTLSCVAALGAMLFNLWLYGHYIETEQLVIPYLKILMSVAFILPPAIVGFLYKRKFPKWCAIISKIGSVLSLSLAILLSAIKVLLNPHLYSEAPWQVYLCVIVLPTVGLILGYGIPTILVQTPSVRRTIALETTFQNVGLTFGIGYLSFPEEIVAPVLVYPALYGVAMSLTGALFAACYHLTERRNNSIAKRKNEDIT